MNSFRLPFFNELRDARNVLIAGAGGGFDVFSGLPLYFNLRAAGKTVHLANLSFSELRDDSAGTWLTGSLVEVTADSEGSRYYFPEKHLSAWFRLGGREVPVYAFRRVGPKPLRAGYERLVARLGIDTIILVDGGTDSLMRGDEEGLGTPAEDMSSIAAVDQLEVPRKMLACLGFGIDTFHGVCHAHVLEAVAELIRDGGYLGAFSLMREMPEVQRFAEATRYVLSQMPENPSIVCTSILDAIEGHFGNHHSTRRTAGSELFINPLMGLYWCFQLEPVARRVLYLNAIRELESFAEVTNHIETFHLASHRPLREARPLPM